MEKKLNLILRCLKLLLQINIVADYSGVYSSVVPSIEALVKEIDEEVMREKVTVTEDTVSIPGQQKSRTLKNFMKKIKKGGS